MSGFPTEPMQTELGQSPSVPWTAGDVWQGLGIVILLGLTFSALLYYFLLSFPPSEYGSFIGMAELLLLVPVWILGLRKYGANLRTLGFRKFKSADLGLGCAFMILAYSFNACYAIILAPFNLRIQSDITPLIASFSSPLMMALSIVVIGPLVEEVFFRGFVFTGLRQNFGWKKAALISAAIFAIFHLELTFVIPGFILGFIFAFLYQRSNSIWPGIIMHILVNAVGLLSTILINQMS